jgi:acetyl-CoA carboxylase carboxyltransferase component
MMNKDMNMKKVAVMTPAEILKGWKKIEIANDANKANNFQTVNEFANAIRKDIAAKVESYKTLVIDTYLDCEYAKVKISKRVAKVPKYARGITK